VAAPCLLEVVVVMVVVEPVDLALQEQTETDHP